MSKHLHIEEVDWNAAKSTLRKLRQIVFIEEQHVSQEEEWDDLDAPSSTRHFVCSIDDKPVATARLLENGQIGRMAVLKEYRGQGIGIALLRKLTQAALQYGNKNIFLNAQVERVNFYQTLGYSAVGEEFIEADIRHIRMELNLDDFDLRTNHFECIYADSVLRLSSLPEYQHHLAQILSITKNRVDILCRQLEPTLFEQTAVVEHISRIARSHPSAKIRLLLRSAKELNGTSHPLIQLTHRLPTKIAVKTLSSDAQQVLKEESKAYIVGDAQRLIYFNNEATYSGFAHYNAKAESKHHLSEFEELWNHFSQTDPYLVRLNL